MRTKRLYAETKKGRCLLREIQFYPVEVDTFLSRDADGRVVPYYDSNYTVLEGKGILVTIDGNTASLFNVEFTRNGEFKLQNSTRRC